MEFKNDEFDLNVSKSKQSSLFKNLSHSQIISEPNIVNDDLYDLSKKLVFNFLNAMHGTKRFQSRNDELILPSKSELTNITGSRSNKFLQDLDYNCNNIKRCRTEVNSISQKRENRDQSFPKCRVVGMYSSKNDSTNNVWIPETNSEKYYSENYGHKRKNIINYMREKQKASIEKPFQGILKSRSIDDRINVPLIRLNDDQIIYASNNEYFGYKGQKRNHQKYNMNRSIYDELSKEGMFDFYDGIKAWDDDENVGPIIDLIREKRRLNSRLTAKPPRKQIVRLKPAVSIKCTNEDHSPPEKPYKDDISAYSGGYVKEIEKDLDICEETDCTTSIAQDVPADHNHETTNPSLDFVDGAGIVPQKSCVIMEEKPILEGQLSNTVPISIVVPKLESPPNKFGDEIKSKESSVVRRTNQLKEAMLKAQKKLSTNQDNLNDMLSERISTAIENYIKAKEKANRVLDTNNEDADLGFNKCSDNTAFCKIKEHKSESDNIVVQTTKEYLSNEIKTSNVHKEGRKPKHQMRDTFSLFKHNSRQISEEKDILFSKNSKNEILADVIKQKISAMMAKKRLRRDLQFSHEKPKGISTNRKRMKPNDDPQNHIIKSNPFEAFIKNNYDIINTYPRISIESVSDLKWPRYHYPSNANESAKSLRQENGEMVEVACFEETTVEENYPSDISICNNVNFSEMDNNVASFSESSTTLSDRSEFEARLLALQTEINKKHHFVSMLKNRQKETKRDQMKQKEIILQKQIDMYDAYISKLRKSIKEIDIKMEEVDNVDPPTLQCSIVDPQEVESTTDQINVIVPTQITDVFSGINVVCDVQDLKLEEVLTNNIKGHLKTNEGPFNMVSHYNIGIDGDGVDLKLMHRIQTFDPYLNLDTTDGVQRAPKVDPISLYPRQDSTNYFLEEIFCKDNNKTAVNCAEGSRQSLMREVTLTDNKSMNKTMLEDPLYKNTDLILLRPQLPCNLPRPTDHHPEKDASKQKEINGKERRQDTSTEIFIVEGIEDGTSSSIDSESVVAEPTQNNPKTSFSRNCNSVEVYYDYVNFLIKNHDDDGSSISDVEYIKGSECYLRNHVDVCNVEGSPYIKEGDLDISKNKLIISKSGSDLCLCSNIGIEEEYFAEGPLGIIKAIDFEKAQEQIEGNKEHFVAESFHCTSFMAYQTTTLKYSDKERPQCSTTPVSKDLMAFSQVAVTETPKEMKQSHKPKPSDETLSQFYPNNRDAISEKIRWLIPLTMDHVNKHIDSAIMHFFNAKQNCEGKFEDSLETVAKYLPHLYRNTMSTVPCFNVEKELSHSSNELRYVDKRLIFQLVKEIFSRIYSTDQNRYNAAWVHPSIMVKRKNYSAWGGQKPPESYDLLHKVVYGQISSLFKKTNFFLENTYSKKNFSKTHLQSRVTKWCLGKQKDPIDQLLINDVHKEESEWIYYDDAEEEIKIQIAEDIFRYLVTDTTSWLRSALS